MLGLLGPERVTITDYKSSDVRDPAVARAAGAGVAPAPDLRDGLRGDDRPAARSPSRSTSSTRGSSARSRSSRRGSRRRAGKIARAAAGIRARDYTPKPERHSPARTARSGTSARRASLARRASTERLTRTAPGRLDRSNGDPWTAIDSTSGLVRGGAVVGAGSLRSALVVTTARPGRGADRWVRRGACSSAWPIGLTLVPIAWLVVFGRQRRIDLRRRLDAARSGAARGSAASSPSSSSCGCRASWSCPIALFILALAVVAEATLSAER